MECELIREVQVIDVSRSEILYGQILNTLGNHLALRKH